ncbi:hypothetical protein DV515_00013715 [Chloebia gouldiae]|uniref:Uncharacterized protein n=1 Tax=Chloebia gouldiae TaxID=44316 RepID=A0A3L8S027_CHLGU|nr:hypothetical protein DV515_00013715 [Chloebia gouldiae]
MKQLGHLLQYRRMCRVSAPCVKCIATWIQRGLEPQRQEWACWLNRGLAAVRWEEALLDFCCGPAG